MIAGSTFLVYEVLGQSKSLVDSSKEYLENAFLNYAKSYINFNLG